jgi:hypothetical protein
MDPAIGLADAKGLLGGQFLEFLGFLLGFATELVIAKDDLLAHENLIVLPGIQFGFPVIGPKFIGQQVTKEVGLADALVATKDQY